LISLCRTDIAANVTCAPHVRVERDEALDQLHRRRS
jgi:hypothetical protein